MMFLKGDFDSVAVPRANMWDLLQTDQQYTPLSGIRLYYNMPALSNDAMFYCFTVDPTSPYVPKVGTGASATPKPDLFSNVHMRRAFNYALNFTTYLRDAWWGEAIQQASWWVDGLQPAAAKNTTLVPYTYDPAQMQAELQAAGVWDSGFEVTILYNLGNDQRKIAAEMIRDAFRALGTKYVVNVVGVDWPVILDYMEMFYMPVYYIGWLADFAYPDNFARPFMHSSGDFSYYQNYSDPHVDYLIDHAIIETNETKAIEMYQELQYIYWRDAVSLPIMQAVGRRWERDWVRGYYYNQLYPGLFFYDLWKTIAEPPTQVDVSTYKVELSPVSNISIWLLNQGANVSTTPAVKLNLGTGSTTPIASATATVHRYDNGLAPVLVYLVWVGKTSSGHTEEFGYAAWLLPGGQEITLGPKNISDVMPAVGQYEFYIVTMALGNVVNINVTADFDSGYFYALGFCDINKDNKVNIQDYQLVKLAVGTTPGAAKWNWAADVDCTNSVTMKDYQTVKTKIPTTYTPS
jgi:peptide/nickel transport system substrate-binding protein